MAESVESLRRTIIAGSEEDFDVICDFCITDGRRLEAIVYCGECNENLCHECKNNHKKTSATKKHVLQEIVSCCELCKSEGKKVGVIVYCVECKENLCRECTKNYKRTPATNHHVLENMATRSTSQSKTENVTVKYVEVKHVEDINVKTSTDTMDCEINGVVVMKDGRLAVTDYSNQCVKIIDKTDENKSEKVTLTSRPTDITVVGDDQLAVTLGWDRLQFLSVSPSLSARHTITVPGCYHSLTYNKGKFFLVCYDPVRSVHICNEVGNLLQQIDSETTGNKLFKRPSQITLDEDKNVIYVTDSDSNKIVCLYSDGGVMAMYTNDMLQRPEGITTDQHGHLYVCSYRNNRVIQLSSSGQLGNVRIEQKDGILSPYTITYNTGKLYISSWSDKPEYNNNIKVYKLE